MDKLRNIFKNWLSLFSGKLSSKQSSCAQECTEKDVDDNFIDIPLHSISSNALKVVHRLNDFGYEAYLVGGCIRDLLLGLHPKDFDIATNARPEQVRSIFRNSRIIGRRFKLIHVLFGREVIEVATFRASHEGREKKEATRDNRGRILRDNVYGSLEDDAERRDFTINAFYFSPGTEGKSSPQLIDFSTGMTDLKMKTIRLLGNPRMRYSEDPVRMLRAARFAAKLNFSIEPETESPIFELASLLDGIPSARLFDESLKLLLNGNGLNTMEELQRLQLFEHLFPEASSVMKDHLQAEQLFKAALKSSDLRIQQNRPVTPAFIYAALLWHPMQLRQQALISNGTHYAIALEEASNETIRKQCLRIAVPKRFTFAVREIWFLQDRLVKHSPRKIESIVSQPRFRAAYDFLLLREKTGEYLNNAGSWWTDYQKEHPVESGKQFSYTQRNKQHAYAKSRKKPGYFNR